jgi:hypothetical protein
MQPRRFLKLAVSVVAVDSWRAKAEGLLAKAAHPDTPVEEARTAAMLLVRLMAAHDLTVTPKTLLAPLAAPQWPTVSREGRHITAAFDSKCHACRKEIEAGSWVWWVRTVGVYCSECEKLLREEK